MKGTTQWCLAQYGKTLSPGSADAYRPLASFCGVTVRTAARWIRGKQQIIGLGLVKLRCFLYAQGFDPTELEGMSPAVRGVALLISHGIISFEEVQDELGLTRDHLMYKLLGKGGTSPSSEQVLAAIALRHQSLLHNLVQRARVRVMEVESQPTVRPPARPDEAAVPSANGSFDHEALLTVVSNQIRALRPLVEIILTDSFSTEERHRLRRLVGDDGVYHLSTDLIRLCSEKARSSVRAALKTKE